MKTIKTAPGPTGAERIAYSDRANALGLEVRHGQIDPSSAKNVAGGLPALQAQLVGDTLDQSGLENLRKAGFLAPLLGQDLPISERKSRDVQALATDLRAATGAIRRATEAIESSGEVKNSQLLAPLEKLIPAVKRFNELVVGPTGAFAQVDGRSARALAESVGSTASALADYTSALSQFREAIVAGAPEGLWNRMQYNAIVGNIHSSIEANDYLQKLADVYAFTVPAGPAPQVSPSIRQLEQEFLAGADGGA